MISGAEVMVFQLVEVEEEICLLAEVLKLAEAQLLKTAAVAAGAWAVENLNLAGIGLVVIVLKLVAVNLGTVVAAAAVV